MADATDEVRTEYPILRNAPITEAVIDLRVGQKAGVDVVPALEALAGSQLAAYPQVLTQNVFQGSIRFDEEGLQASGDSSEIIGYQIRDEANIQVALLQVGGLTVSRLRPYESWGLLFDEAWRLWELYRDSVQPESVTRLATRFLNHITLPVSYRTEDYFATPIQVPEGLPNVLAAYHYRYVMDVGDGVRANVTLSSEPVEPGAENSTVLFDIDCYWQRGLLPDDIDLPGHLGNLRHLKNRIFFESLTEKTLDMFR